MVKDFIEIFNFQGLDTLIKLGWDLIEAKLTPNLNRLEVGRQRGVYKF